jgi:hypothetical protein
MSTEPVSVNGQEVSVIHYRGKRVITLAQMDAVHGRPPGTAGRAFREHQKKLIKNQEYFLVSANEQIDELRRFNCGPRRGKPIILLVRPHSPSGVISASFVNIDPS